jgi:hypothetical protein
LLNAYDAMGRPIDPTRRQVEELSRAAELPPPETKTLHHGELTIALPPQGLALIEFQR